MVVPAEFKELAHLFLQDSDEEALSLSEFIASAVQLLNPKDVLGAKAYVDGLLAAGLSEAELNAIWESCHPNYGIDQGKMAEFLSEIQRQLGKAAP